MAERTISDVLTKPDAALEMTLRPSLFSDFTGQAKVKERLEITVAAAKQRGEAIDHILLSGPPGLGKTTLANIIAKAMGANLKNTSGPTIEKAGDLAGLLTNLEEGDVLFIDEIHRLRRVLVEYLCPAMRDFKLDIIIDQGPNAQSVRLNLPHFSIIGTTTRPERVASILLSCFPVIEELTPYRSNELARIAFRFAQKMSLEIDAKSAEMLAAASGGTPRGLLNLLRRLRDYSLVKSEAISAAFTERAMQILAPIELVAESTQERDSIPPSVRREVWRRDEGKCVKCGSRERLEFDHIIPVSKGGSNTARNIELLCEICNRAKGATID